MTSESVLTNSSNPTTTREALLTAALRLFARKWFAVVSVAEICREAGVSNGLFYRYFRSKVTGYCVDMEKEAIALLDDLTFGAPGTPATPRPRRTPAAG